MGLNRTRWFAVGGTNSLSIVAFIRLKGLREQNIWHSVRRLLEWNNSQQSGDIRMHSKLHTMNGEQNSFNLVTLSLECICAYNVPTL